MAEVAAAMAMTHSPGLCGWFDAAPQEEANALYEKWCGVLPRYAHPICESGHEGCNIASNRATPGIRNSVLIYACRLTTPGEHGPGRGD